MVVLAQATGLRQSELLGLRWSSFLLEKGLLHLDQQLGRDGVLKAVKSEAGRRSLPLLSPVVSILRTHREEQDQQRTQAAIREDRDLVLSTRNGRPIGHRNAHRSWTRWLKQAGVAHRGIHHMRHAYAAVLAEEGVHERVAQYLLGHADSRMTRVINTHVTGSMIERAGEAVERSAGRMFPDASAQVGPGVGLGQLEADRDAAAGGAEDAG